MKIKSTFVIVLSICLALVQPVFASDDDVETRGFLSAISDTEATVNGVTYILDGSTEYRDINDNPIDKSAFNVGDFVKIKGEYNNSNQLIAEELEFEDESDDNGGSTDRIIVRGIIEAYSNNSITLGGETFKINDRTKFEGLDDQPAGPDDFAVNDIAKVKGYLDGNSELVASEIEKENDIGGGNNSSRPGAIRLSCQVPNKKALEEGVRRSIEQALKQAGATQVNVVTTAKITDKESSQKVDPTAAAHGLSVKVDLTNPDNLVDFSGPVSIQNCQATARVRVLVTGFHPLLGQFRKTFVRMIELSGVFATRNRGRS